MKWIFLIGNSNFGLENLRRVKYSGSTSTYYVDDKGKRLCVEFEGGHLIYDIMTDFSDFAEVLDAVPYSNPTIIMVSYTSSEILKRIICQNDFPQDIFVDNDRGILVPLKEYIECGMPMEG